MCCACCFLPLLCLALRLKQAKGVVAITWRIEMPIYVHNKRKYKGRGEYIGRPSPLGNPYSHLNKGTLAKYQTATLCREEPTGKRYIQQTVCRVSGYR